MSLEAPQTNALLKARELSRSDTDLLEQVVV
jgi:hypothetical protein